MPARLPKPPRRDAVRYGIGEWFGRPFHRLKAEERFELLTHANERKPGVTCPFRSSFQAFDPRGLPGTTNCTKQGGVCSIREYVRDAESIVTPRGGIRTTCPYRFLDNGAIFEWIGEVILSNPSPLVVREIEFLEIQNGIEDEAREIGYIDNVLVHPTRHPLDWCALEIQAVYFSGASMGKEFTTLRTPGEALPFPAGSRHPDYRSSGPKRLMPQLQIKVPSLRRWGKKMAVVVDENFFAALGTMDNVPDISNCDIAWFVVRFDETESRFVLKRAFHRFTTLERAVEGLTGGHPVSLGKFEHRIFRRLERTYPEYATSLNPGQ
ncbi:MAG: NotI family restriction endonuclease [Bryobacteraceae bacterium]